MERNELEQLLRRFKKMSAGELEAFLEGETAEAAMTRVVIQHFDSAEVEVVPPDSDGPRSPEPFSRVLARLEGRLHPAQRYRHKGEVARGGQGAILRVWDVDLHRDLAMKVLLAQGEKSGDASDLPSQSLGRFLDEAQVTGQLDHPGIVPVHELGLDEEGRIYFTMKLVKGRIYSEVIEEVHAEAEGWTLTRALGVLSKICDAMAYAHSKGVIHRDLKPANVMVGRYGEVFVMDWGLAKIIGAESKADTSRVVSATQSIRTDRGEEAAGDPNTPLITLDGTVVGTPAYMPPEQARGDVDSLDARSDVYSLGAMLYQLLSGEMPYVEAGSRPSAQAIWRQVVDGPPQPLEQLVPSEMPELVAICGRAMARRPEERYASADELGEDVRAYLEGRVVRAYEQGAWAELRKWTRRNRLLAVTAVAAVLTLVVGLVASLAFMRQSDRNASLASKREVEAKASAQTARSKEREAQALAVLASDRERETREALELAEERRAEAKTAQRQAEERDYVARIRSAAANLKTGNGREAMRQLEGCAPATRGWEWGHLSFAGDANSSRHTVDVSAHFGSEARDIQFRPDGRLLVATRSEIFLWEPGTGRRQTLYDPPFGRGGSQQVTLSPDGRFCIYHQSPRTSSQPPHGAWIVDIEAERRIDLRADDSIRCAVFTGEESLVIVGCDDGSLQWLDFRGGETVRTVQWGSAGIECLAADPTGTRVVSGPDPLALRDIGNELDLPLEHGALVELHTVLGAGLPPEKANMKVSLARFVELVAMSPDGSALATVDQRRLALSELSSADVRFQVELPNFTGAAAGRCVAWSADGHYLALGAGHEFQPELIVIDARDGRVLSRFLGHSEAIICVAFDALGERVATGSADGTIRVWSLEDKPVSDLGVGRAAAFTLDESLVAIARGEFVELVTTVGSRSQLNLGPAGAEVLAVAIATERDWLFAGDSEGRVNLWNWRTGERLATFGSAENAIAELVVSPDGERVATRTQPPRFVAGAIGPLEFWGLQSGVGVEFKILAAHTPISVRGEPKENSVTRWWDKGYYDEGLAMDRDGTTIVARGPWPQLFDLRSGELSSLDPIAQGRKESGLSFESRRGTVAIDASSGRLATSRANAALLFDSNSGQFERQMVAHAGQIRSTTFSGDGSRLFTGADDGTVRIWDVSSGEALLTLDHVGAVNSISVSAKNRFVAATVDGGSQVRLWESRLLGEGANVEDELSLLAEEFVARVPLADTAREDALENWPTDREILDAYPNGTRLQNLFSDDHPFLADGELWLLEAIELETPRDSGDGESRLTLEGPALSFYAQSGRAFNDEPRTSADHELESVGVFRNDERHGPWLFWHRGGSLRAHGRFDAGMQAGDWIVRRPDGAIDPKRSGTYVDGVRQE